MAAGRRQSDGSVGDRQTELRGSPHLAVGHRHRCHAQQTVQSIAVLTDRLDQATPFVPIQGVRRVVGAPSLPNCRRRRLIEICGEG